jgi:hypothetical protein
MYISIFKIYNYFKVWFVTTIYFVVTINVFVNALIILRIIETKITKKFETRKQYFITWFFRYKLLETFRFWKAKYTLISKIRVNSLAWNTIWRRISYDVNYLLKHFLCSLNNVFFGRFVVTPDVDSATEFKLLRSGIKKAQVFRATVTFPPLQLIYLHKEWQISSTFLDKILMSYVPCMNSRVTVTKGALRTAMVDNRGD